MYFLTRLDWITVISYISAIIEISLDEETNIANGNISSTVQGIRHAHNVIVEFSLTIDIYHVSSLKCSGLITWVRGSNYSFLTKRYLHLGKQKLVTPENLSSCISLPLSILHAPRKQLHAMKSPNCNNRLLHANIGSKWKPFFCSLITGPTMPTSNVDCD